MEFILTALATYWLFRGLRAQLPGLPGVAWDVIVPLLFLGLWFIPPLAVACFAGAAVVSLLYHFTRGVPQGTVRLPREPKRYRTPPIG